LLVAWKRTPAEIPRDVEERMIVSFSDDHGGHSRFAAFDN
jgi:hypothetical protein